MDDIYVYDGRGKVPFDVSTVIVQNGVKRIRNSALLYNENLASIYLPYTVASIETYAFGGCCNLRSINLPSSIKEIGLGAFHDCRSLSFMHLPPSVKSLGAGAFHGCTSLTSINIPSSITTIHDTTFRGCRSLTSISLSHSIQKIDDYAFYDCSQLQTIQLPNQVKAVQPNTFAFCTSLTSIDLPTSITHIHDEAFWSCESLHSITLPQSCKYIGNRAFEFCKSIASITLPADIAYVGDQALRGCVSLQIIHMQSSALTPTTSNQDMYISDDDASSINDQVSHTTQHCKTHSILPLHFLLMFGHVRYYKDEIGDLITADPASLTTCDTIYNMYPFLLAACTPRLCYFERQSDGDVEHLETVFILLREAPWVMDILTSNRSKNPYCKMEY